MKQSYPGLYKLMTDDPDYPGRMVLDHPSAQRLAAEISPDSQPVDLGGVMSLNIWLNANNTVLRIHQPSMSKRRILALQMVRLRLMERGLTLPLPLPWHGKTVVRCGDRWAELDEYIPNTRLPHTADAYLWLFSKMGIFQAALYELDISVPRPPYAPYAPPSSIRRWLPVTKAAVQDDPEALATIKLMEKLAKQLRQQWLPETRLPKQLIHGDFRLSNVRQTNNEGTVYFDLGFMAWRPRVYELAYSLFFMFLGLGGHEILDDFDWSFVGQLIEAYEATATNPLTQIERQALAPLTASVAFYAAALDGFTENPIQNLHTRLPFLQVSAWLLKNPDRLLQV
ncbi:MAG: phosphotransferase [Chloroflexota bacterium]